MLEPTIVQLPQATKLVETLSRKGAFSLFNNFKGENKASPPPPPSPPCPPCNVVPLFELPVEKTNAPTLDGEEELGCDSFVLWDYYIWVRCLNFVADCRYCYLYRNWPDVHSRSDPRIEQALCWPQMQTIFTSCCYYHAHDNQHKFINLVPLKLCH